MAALTGLIPMSQITDGSDYPYYPLTQIENLRRTLSPQDVTPQFPAAMPRGCYRV
jgi:hypothetical protein